MRNTSVWVLSRLLTAKWTKQANLQTHVGMKLKTPDANKYMCPNPHQYVRFNFWKNCSVDYTNFKTRLWKYADFCRECSLFMRSKLISTHTHADTHHVWYEWPWGRIWWASTEEALSETKWTMLASWSTRTDAHRANCVGRGFINVSSFIHD